MVHGIRSEGLISASIVTIATRWTIVVVTWLIVVKISWLIVVVSRLIARISSVVTVAIPSRIAAGMTKVRLPTIIIANNMRERFRFNWT